jgi:spore germination protein GerM
MRDTTLDYHTLYFVDQTGSLLIPVSRPAPSGSLDEQMEAAVRELIAGPEPGSGLIGPVPDGTSLLDLTRDGGTITANFDSQPGNDQALIALALTLTEFNGIHQVQVQVNGNDTGLDGGQQPIKRPILNPDNPDNLPEEFSSRKTSFLPIFFRYNGYFVRITRLVPSTDTPVRATVEELLKGPGDTYGDLLTSPIPPDTELRPNGINPNDREIVVDLTQEFADAPDRDAALNALVFSLTELRDSGGGRLYNEVEVRVEGSSLETFWGSKYDGPFERPVLNPE